MGSFHRTNLSDEWAFVRGAARILYAPENQAFPSGINDVVVTASGVNQYNAQSGWVDLGATKTGINISVNNAEETFEVDQIIGDIDSAPVNWEASVATALAEMTLEHLQVAWEGSEITIGTGQHAGERTMGYGQPDEYTRRRLAVVFKNRNDKLRAFVFRRVQLQPVESAVGFNKTGEQVSIPVQFKCLADDTISDIKKRFFVVIEQP